MITSQGWRAQAATTRMITEGKRQSLRKSWAKEPLNKSRVTATAAFRDEMHEATRRPWQAPHGRAARHSRSPGKPRPFGFRRNGLICVVARLANRMNYS